MITRDDPDEDGWRKKNFNKFDMRHTLNWAIQLTDIIQILNDCGIIYGDLIYSNIMIRDDGKLVLIDYGFGFTLDYTG